MLGGLSGGVAAQSPSKRSKSPGAVVQSQLNALNSRDKLKVFSNPSVAHNVTTNFFVKKTND